FLWDVENHKALGDPYTMAQGKVDGVAANPDGSLLAIANSNRVLLWDLAARAPLGEPLPSARVMVFSPDGRGLVTAPSRGSPTIWDVDEESWRRRACAIASRNLSPAEWKEIYKDEDVSYRKTCPSSPIHPAWIDEVRKKAKDGNRAEAESLSAMINKL